MDWADIFFDGVLAAIGPLGAAYALSAIGLNLQFGYTGLLNFGHVAFMMAGAYGTAITVDLGGSLWFGVFVGIACGALLGLLLGMAAGWLGLARAVAPFWQSSFGRPLRAAILCDIALQTLPGVQAATVICQFER